MRERVPYGVPALGSRPRVEGWPTAVWIGLGGEKEPGVSGGSGVDDGDAAAAIMGSSRPRQFVERRRRW
jgi:hypothetical protein